MGKTWTVEGDGGGLPQRWRWSHGGFSARPPALVLFVFPLVFKAAHSQFKCPFASNTGCRFLIEVQLIETDTENPPSVCRNQHLRSSNDWFKSQSPKGQVPSRLAFFFWPYCAARGILPNRGSNPGPLHYWEHRLLTTHHPGSPHNKPPDHRLSYLSHHPTVARVSYKCLFMQSYTNINTSNSFKFSQFFLLFINQIKCLSFMPVSTYSALSFL